MLLCIWRDYCCLKAAVLPLMFFCESTHTERTDHLAFSSCIDEFGFEQLPVFTQKTSFLSLFPFLLSSLSPVISFISAPLTHFSSSAFSPFLFLKKKSTLSSHFLVSSYHIFQFSTQSLFISTILVSSFVEKLKCAEFYLIYEKTLQFMALTVRSRQE